MASKVIGFRVPEDIAEELEKVSKEHGMSVAKFMRSLVDETLYPGSDKKSKENSDTVTPEQIEAIQEIETLKNKINNLAYRFNAIPNTTKDVQELITLVNNNKVSTDHTYNELRREVNQLRSQLNPVTELSLKVKKIESEMTRMTTKISSIERNVKRQPTDETYTLTFRDGSEHRFKVYQSSAGLVKPHVAYNDLALGKRYVDLSEPLD